MGSTFGTKLKSMLALLLLACACGGSATVDAGKSAAKDAGEPGLAPTFSAIFTDVIVATGCNGGTLCHAGTVGNLTMNTKDQAYAALVGVKAMGMNLVQGKGANCADSGLTRVEPGKPDESLLMMKIEHMQPCGDPMPPTSVVLAADTVAQVRAWITKGAKNN
jgi:hypothetical protein